MRFLVVISLLLIAKTAIPQHPYFYTINDEDGLPSNEVYQVIQDDFGYMWIGCDAGLFRYDGFNFKGYYHSKQNSKSISNLKIDAKGSIWCQNFTGQIFTVQKDSLVIFYDASGQSKQYPSFTIDKQNNIWIATDSTILVFSSNKKLLKKYGNSFFHIANLTQWIDIYAFNNSIYSLNASGTLIKFWEDFSFELENIPPSIALRAHFFELKKELHLLTEQNPIRKYFITPLKNQPLKSKEIIPDRNTSIIYKLLDCEDKWILGTSSGALLLNQKLEAETLSTTLFPESKISFAYKDREGNYWFTSLQDGIFVIPSMKVTVFNKANSSLTDNNIFSLTKSKNNNLFVGTYSGEVYELLPKTNTIKVLFKSTENKFRAVRKIIEEDDKIFVARGQFCIESNSETILPKLTNTRDFFKVNDTIFYTTSDRAAYAVNNNGIYEITILINNGGKKITYDSVQHIVYFACTNGLFQFKQNAFTEIKFNNESIFASDLLFDEEKLWIATHTNGILTYYNNKITLENKINNLLNDQLIKCFAKNNSHLFISNAEGLNCINLKSRTNRVLNAFDGLAYTEINDIEIIDNNIYLATIKGLIKIPINIRAVNKIAPHIAITKVAINGIIKKSSSLKIFYKDQIKIDFISSSLRSRGKFNYAYRISNLNENWSKISSKSASVNFPSLPPGDYVFEVVAINEDGFQSKEPAKINIHVEGPYWQKWWFYIIVALIIIFIVAFIFILRIRYLNQKAIAKNRVLSSQLTALKAQMNPHFMYNTLNSIQDLIILNDLKSTNYYLSRFSNLMRKILSASGNNKITIDEEIEILSLYLELEKLRFGDDFTFEIIKSNEVISSWQIPSMILQPYIENAIKHGLLHVKGHKKLIINFFTKDNLLCITIEDNGIGRIKSAEIHERQGKANPSFASKATEKRIDLLSQYDNKTYKVEITDLYENKEPNGTLVTLQFPI